MKKILTLLLCAALPLLNFNAHAQKISSKVKLDSTQVEARVLADSLINMSYNYLGRPYVYGAAGPRYFDCSGMTQYLYKKFGYHLHRSAKGQLKDGREVKGDISNLQKGDIVFFMDKNNVRVGHVGLFIELDRENNSFKFIHAAKKGIMITTCSASYYKTRFCGARRIFPDFIPDHDTTSVSLPFDPQADIVVKPDTLSLSEGDSRIVLFANGSWASVDSYGRMSSAQNKGDKIMVYPDGRWVAVKDVKVTIPIVPNDPADKPLKSSTPSGTGSGSVYHTIKAGDTLGGIARKYHTSVAEICRLNNMKSTSVLKIGKRLIIK